MTRKASPFPMPELALEQHTAVLGKTGSGKTSTTKLIIEHVVAEDYRVCVLDPIKSDWWGVTSSADGKKPGLPFTILGGPRGHVPLSAASGKTIGELVARGKLPLSILDMKHFGPGDHQKFFIAFAETLTKRMKGVLYLVLEEAHLFAPKELSGVGGENMAIYYAKLLATAGRSMGVRLLLATQRTQALHNALLGSCDTMIVHRMTAPADQQPVLKWLKANVTDKAVQAEIESGMSSLKTGTAWLCSGEAQVFEKIAWPRIATYDNSATPDKNTDRREVKQAAIDVGALQDLLKTEIEHAAQNDPVKLKDELARLKRELAAAQKHPAAPAAPIDEAKLQAMRDAAYATGFKQGAESRNEEIADAFNSGADAVLEQITKGAAQARAKLAPPKPRAIAPPARVLTPPPPRPAPAQARGASPGPGQAVSRERPLAPSTAPASAGSMTIGAGAKADVLAALSFWEKIGHATPTKDMVAAVAGLKPGGSTSRARFAELKNAGLIDYPGQGNVTLTDQGRQIAPPAPRGTVVEIVRGHFGHGAEGRMFDILADQAGVPIHRDDLARALDMEPGGSTYRARIAGLAKLELLDRDSAGNVRLQDWVLS